jgi:hypothetical protein
MQVLTTAPASPQVRALLGLPHHVLQKIVDAAFDRLRDDTRMIELDEFQRVFADAHEAHAQVCDEIDEIDEIGEIGAIGAIGAIDERLILTVFADALLLRADRSHTTLMSSLALASLHQPDARSSNELISSRFIPPAGGAQQQSYWGKALGGGGEYCSDCSTAAARTRVAQVAVTG